VLGEQADPAAAAAGSPDGLIIATTVEDLPGWLARQYVPTPVLSPWNSGSGFGPKDREPLRALEAILAHPSPRLALLREAIPVARDVVGKARARRRLSPGCGRSALYPAYSATLAGLSARAPSGRSARWS
jgi:CRISPR-associated protein Csx17